MATIKMRKEFKCGRKELLSHQAGSDCQHTPKQEAYKTLRMIILCGGSEEPDEEEEVAGVGVGNACFIALICV